MPRIPIQQPDIIQNLIPVTTADTNNSFRQRDTRSIGYLYRQTSRDLPAYFFSFRIPEHINLIIIYFLSAICRRKIREITTAGNHNSIFQCPSECSRYSFFSTPFFKNNQFRQPAYFHPSVSVFPLFLQRRNRNFSPTGRIKKQKYQTADNKIFPRHKNQLHKIQTKHLFSTPFTIRQYLRRQDSFRFPTPEVLLISRYSFKIYCTCQKNGWLPAQLS